ncbi:MAG: hypothetical protein KF889_04895 [Alphaproteobacteria bacterium]|nr:hypothetical protein [Alphaproteobacteria bacterium]MCW5742206.1 hypothetical protein [Alphaproteobacteria bacterium]
MEQNANNQQTAESTAATQTEQTDQTQTDQTKVEVKPDATTETKRPKLSLKMDENISTESDDADSGVEIEDASDTSKLPRKFKTVDDLSKAYAESEKRMRELETQMKDAPAAPDEYVDNDEVFTRHGLAWQNDEQRDAWRTIFKEERLPQKTVDRLTDKYGEQLNAIVSQYGTPVDDEAETAKLVEKYGDKAETRIAAQNRWAIAKLPADVAKRLLPIANGRLLIDMMMDSQGGAKFERTDAAPGGAGSLDEIIAKKKAILNHPARDSQTSEGKRMRAELDDLIRQQHKLESQK